MDSFEAPMMRENGIGGFFVSLVFTSGTKIEIDSFFRRADKVMVPPKVRDVIDEEIALKLA